MGLFGKKTDKNDQDNSDNDGTEKIKQPADDAGRKKIIYVVCALLVVGLVLEGGIFGEGEEQVTEEKPVKKKKKNKLNLKKKPKVSMKEETQKPAETMAMKEPEVKKAEVIDPPVAMEEKPVEIKMAESKPMMKEEKPTQDMSDSMNKPMMNDESSDQMMQDDLQKNLTQAPDENSEETEEEMAEMKKEKKEVKAVFAPVPNYESLGRGLVYNCVDLHWACLNRSNYYQCRNNKKWNVQEGKKIKCVDFQVYASVDDCEMAQQLNVDKIKDVKEFCMNNSGSNE